MSDLILDLSVIDEKSRMSVLGSTRASGWQVTHESKPKVHPARKMSRFYYRFMVPDSIDRRRAQHVAVALSKAS
jgi:hypothetical protein